MKVFPTTQELVVSEKSVLIGKAHIKLVIPVKESISSRPWKESNFNPTEKPHT